MNILVTAGATREPWDEVRYLSNVSTGATGAALAEALAGLGHTVTLLHGTGATLPAAPMRTETFSSAADLGAKLRARLGAGDFEAVVMAAAVADYRPETATAGKLGSEAETLTLRLARNPKMLPQLRGWSPRPLTVVGFKLTVGANTAARQAAVAAQFATGGVDAVVHNDLNEIHPGGHPFHFYAAAGQPPHDCSGTAGLSRRLDEWLRSRRP